MKERGRKVKEKGGGRKGLMRDRKRGVTHFWKGECSKTATGRIVLQGQRHSPLNKRKEKYVR